MSIGEKIAASNSDFFGPVKRKEPVVAGAGRGLGAAGILAMTAALCGADMMPSLPSRFRGVKDPFVKPRNTNNDPDRAPGMKGFAIRDGRWLKESEKGDGPYMIVYAGTLKSALKKAKLLRAQGVIHPQNDTQNT